MNLQSACSLRMWLKYLPAVIPLPSLQQPFAMVFFCFVAAVIPSLQQSFTMISCFWLHYSFCFALFAVVIRFCFVQRPAAFTWLSRFHIVQRSSVFASFSGHPLCNSCSTHSLYLLQHSFALPSLQRPSAFALFSGHPLCHSLQRPSAFALFSGHPLCHSYSTHSLYLLCSGHPLLLCSAFIRFATFAELIRFIFFAAAIRSGLAGFCFSSLRDQAVF